MERREQWGFQIPGLVEQLTEALTAQDHRWQVQGGTGMRGGLVCGAPVVSLGGHQGHLKLWHGETSPYICDDLDLLFMWMVCYYKLLEVFLY